MFFKLNQAKKKLLWTFAYIVNRKTSINKIVKLWEKRKRKKKEIEIVLKIFRSEGRNERKKRKKEKKFELQQCPAKLFVDSSEKCERFWVQTMNLDHIGLFIW